MTKSSLTRPVASFSTFQTMPFGTTASFVNTRRKNKEFVLLLNGGTWKHCGFSFRIVRHTGIKSHKSIVFITKTYKKKAHTRKYWALLYFCHISFLLWQSLLNMYELQRWMKVRTDFNKSKSCSLNIMSVRDLCNSLMQLWFMRVHYVSW